MDLTMNMVTLKNGMRMNCVSSSRPSNPSQAGTSEFAAQLNRVSEAAKQAVASGSTKIQAAFSSLTPDSKAVLERINAGDSNVTKEEWTRFRQELAAAGLLTQDELFYSDPDVICVGNISNAVTDANGVIAGYGLIAFKTCTPSSISWCDLEWTGDPLQYLNQLLKALREEQDSLNKQLGPDGAGYDMSYLTRQIGANEKVSGLVNSLLELC